MINLNDSIIVGNIDSNVIKRIKNILTTPAGTVPFDREFGINYLILDKPINEAKVLIMAEIINKLKKYEDKIIVKSIKFNIDGSILIPKVVIGSE